MFWCHITEKVLKNKPSGDIWMIQQLSLFCCRDEFWFLIIPKRKCIIIKKRKEIHE